MVDINLIPPALRKDGKNTSGVAVNLSRDILLGVWSAVAFLLVAVHLALAVVWLIGNAQLASRNAQWQKLLPDKNVIDGIHKESGELAKKIKTVSDITTSKAILWAPKFNAISDALPRGVWIRRMSFDKNGLVLDGSVVSKNQNEINNVGLLVSGLKQDDGFMKDFLSLEVNSIQRGRADAVEVTDFTVMAKLK